MKQTAVEWLEEMIAKMEAYGGDLPPLMVHIKKAKEMEKQQQGYSEEEVRNIIKLSCEQGMLIQRTINDKVKIPYTRIKDFTIKMFEQFKKL